MAAKPTKTLRDQYSAALAKSGKALQDYEVLGFRFPEQSRARLFAMELATQRAPYVLLDAATTLVRVVVPAEHTLGIMTLSRIYDGFNTSPMID